MRVRINTSGEDVPATGVNNTRAAWNDEILSDLFNDSIFNKDVIFQDACLVDNFAIFDNQTILRALKQNFSI